MSFPRGTEMFQFPRFAFRTLCVQVPNTSHHPPCPGPTPPQRPPSTPNPGAPPRSAVTGALAGRGVPKGGAPRIGHENEGSEGGFPHSEIRGSKPVRGSPRLIAAYHVLHRLSAPRHPPDTLVTLVLRFHRRRPVPAAPPKTRETAARQGPASPPNNAETAPNRGGKTFSCFPERAPERAHPRFTMSNQPRAPARDARQAPPPAPGGARTRRKSGRNGKPPTGQGRESGPREGAAGRKPRPARRAPGGARRDRTDGLMLAKHALSQLSYRPERHAAPRRGGPGKARTSDLTLIKRAL